MPADLKERVGVRQPVHVGMEDRRRFPDMLVQEAEGGADDLGRIDARGSGHRLHKRRLARAEVAAKRDERGPREGRGEPAGQRREGSLVRDVHHGRPLRVLRGRLSRRRHGRSLGV